MTVVIFVNGDRFPDQPDQATVGHLIELGGGIPGQYELQEREGEHGKVLNTYSNPADVLTLKDGEHFTTKFTGTINPA